jgi:hypothetical protein
LITPFAIEKAEDGSLTTLNTLLVLYDSETFSLSVKVERKLKISVNKLYSGRYIKLRTMKKLTECTKQGHSSEGSSS